MDEEKRVVLTDEEKREYCEYLDTLYAMDLLGYACFEMRRNNLDAYTEEEFLGKRRLLGDFWTHYRGGW
jgi:hypothetical protein